MSNPSTPPIHILVSPTVLPEQFRLAANSLQCSELHLFANSEFIFSKWEKECEYLGIHFHKHILPSVQIDMLESIYNVGEIVANRNIFLCMNSTHPILCNLIMQFLTLELKLNHQELDSYFSNTGCCYQIRESDISLTPIYPLWDADCQLVIESLTTTGEGMTKQELLDHIKIFQQENFTRDKLNRALIRLERWLEGYSGFIKERRGTRAYVYELNLIVQL